MVHLWLVKGAHSSDNSPVLQTCALFYCWQLAKELLLPAHGSLKRTSKHCMQFCLRTFTCIVVAMVTLAHLLAAGCKLTCRHCDY